MKQNVIWKFPLVVVDQQSIEVPRGAKSLCVQTQHEIPCLWMLVDEMQVLDRKVFSEPKDAIETRRFSLYGTGHPMPENPGKYVGTFQLRGGGLVFHLFEQE